MGNTLKIERVIQQATTEVIEVKLPHFRKKRDQYYAIVSENDLIHILINPYGYFISSVGSVKECFNGTEECSPEEFANNLDACVDELQLTLNKLKQI